MSHAQCGEDQKLKIDILVLTDIPRNLQGHTNKQTMFRCYLQNNTHTLWKNS